MKPAFIINNRNKGAHVYRCVAAALAQTYPCEIIVADFSSTDNSRDEIKRAIAHAPKAADHTVRYIEKDEPTEATMLAVNLAIKWMCEQTKAEWIFQCSSDDYSLPDRVKVCMAQLERLKAEGLDCDGIATTMRFEDPAQPGLTAISGYPTESGFVSGGIGIHRMAFGSTIWAYRKSFLEKAGLEVSCTLDVYLGYLAALGKGYYVIANPQHVHYMAQDADNIGFQGKMRAAEKAGDQETIHRINELNRFQLFELYLQTAARAQHLYPLAHELDRQAMTQMLVNQAVGWYGERKQLHDKKIQPGMI